MSTSLNRMDRILALLTPAQVQDALWMVDVFESWDMPAEEADEWRRRIVAWEGCVECPSEHLLPQ